MNAGERAERLLLRSMEMPLADELRNTKLNIRDCGDGNAPTGSTAEPRADNVDDYVGFTTEDLINSINGVPEQPVASTQPAPTSSVVLPPISGNIVIHNVTTLNIYTCPTNN